jgi:hypothetical protein
MRLYQSKMEHNISTNNIPPRIAQNVNPLFRVSKKLHRARKKPLGKSDVVNKPSHHRDKRVSIHRGHNGKRLPMALQCGKKVQSVK